MPEKKYELLRKIRAVADYQFGEKAGKSLFPQEVSVIISKRTKRIRHVYLDDKLLATLRPTVGLFSLTIEGAQRLAKSIKPPRSWVQVQDDVASFIEKGGDVFAKHVTDNDNEIRPMEEIIILNGKQRVIAVGKAVLSGDEMKAFKRGVAVKVRRGNLEKVKKPTKK
jgi:predicted RNA-binding protein (TIGR00451 family)